MLPASTPRLRFREMTADDLDQMTALLSDPEVMRYYPAPKTRQDAANWIAWNERNYAEHGFGPWIIELHDGTFVGDCGLTVQTVEGERLVEVGYHLMPAWHGRGLATEAACAVRDEARDGGISHLIAIIRPANLPSQRVAEKIGLHLERRTSVHDLDCLVYGADL
ncbi:GNAT family N-acetyltransferase [Spelaeicoccus albus]|nr:GNAT family N-acetyltransferase [Spelaeicoccus albus]